MGHFFGVNVFNGLRKFGRDLFSKISAPLSIYGPKGWPLPLSRKGARRFYRDAFVRGG